MSRLQRERKGRTERREEGKKERKGKKGKTGKYWMSLSLEPTRKKEVNEREHFQYQRDLNPEKEQGKERWKKTLGGISIFFLSPDSTHKPW